MSSNNSSSYEDEKQDEMYVNEDDSEMLDESDVNFDEIPAYSHLPPQDPWRKVKREILKNLNLSRQEEVPNRMQLEQEFLCSENIQEYVKLVIDEDEDPDQLQAILSGSKAVGKYSSCTAVTYLEEDSGDINHLIEPFLDAQGLLLETHRDQLLGDFSHVGIGVGVLGKRLVLVLSFAKKSLNVITIDKSSDSIVVTGKMNRSDVGVYAARIVDSTSFKEKTIVGPAKIQFDPSSSVFEAKISYSEGIEYGPEGRGKNFLEIYVRGNPETIPYGEDSDNKINIKHIELVDRARIEIFPDPRQIFEDAKHEERKKLLEQRKKDFEEERKKSEELQAQERIRTREMQKKEMVVQEDYASSSSVQRSREIRSSSSHPMTPEMEKSRATDERPDSAEESHKSFDESSEEAPDSQIREELITALREASEEEAKLRAENAALEKRVIAIRTKMGNTPGGNSEDASGMNQQKYLNTLANVNQVQYKMNELHETYNNWAKVYEDNIKEKQERCKEIQDYFKEFKREVAKGAESARNGKPIPKKIIDMWEEEEAKRDIELQKVRIDNITLKNRLKKLEEQSKEKEKLADGLHLIDYEQLKIENQTLNEKIEERNEELHKLRKKIETTVQILTHTKEKLKFILAEKSIKETERNSLVGKLESQRKNLHKCKVDLEKERAGYIKNKQDTGIVNSKDLNNDLASKKIKVEDLKIKLIDLEDDYKKMQEIIASAKKITAS